MRGGRNTYKVKIKVLLNTMNSKFVLDTGIILEKLHSTQNMRTPKHLDQFFEIDRISVYMVSITVMGDEFHYP